MEFVLNHTEAESIFFLPFHLFYEQNKHSILTLDSAEPRVFYLLEKEAKGMSPAL